MTQTSRTMLAPLVEANGIVLLKQGGALEQAGYRILWVADFEAAPRADNSFAENYGIESTISLRVQEVRS